MADAGRKDFSDKAKEQITPDSSKSTLDRTKEGITDAGNKIAREAQPDSNKSTGQSIADKIGRSKDDHAHGGTGGSILDKTKHVLGMDKH